MNYGFTERRDLDANRRANGWRWGAARADRRQNWVSRSPPWEQRMQDRRTHHRRRDDRDDEPRLGYVRSGLPERI